MGEDSDEQVIVIKKYANRRLYNTEKSCYVTLDHLAQMVREGTDFVVRDAKSGEDITRSVLTQIIFEQESKGQNLLPVNFLRQLIGMYGDTLEGLVPGYLEQSMRAFSQNHDKMQEQIASAISANPMMSGFESMTKSNMEWMQNAISMFSPFVQNTPKPEADPQDPEAESEFDSLKAQLAAMQEQLSKLMKG